MKKIYALYKGDNYIMDGTKQELAKYLKVQISTINFYKSPTYKRRNKGNRTIVVYLGEEE